jgi:hypothetical protein
MSLIRADIITRARRILNYQEDEIVSAAALYEAFNYASEAWARRTKCLSQVRKISTVGNQQEYALPSGIVEVRSLGYLTGSQYRPFGKGEQIDALPSTWQTDYGDPIRWATRGLQRLILYPTPSGSLTNGLLLDYWYVPTDLAEVATPDTSLVVTGATNANPSTLTTQLSHALSVGHWVELDGVLGNTAVNGLWRVASVPSSTSFTLEDANGNAVAGNGNYVSGGTVQQVLEFPDVHRNGLSLALAREICEMNVEDAALANRLPYVTQRLDAAILEASQEANLDNDPPQMASVGNGRFSDPRLPANWQVRR